MRKRNVDKHIWFDRQEAQDLQKKAKKACLTEAALVRLLLRGYEPREKPDERFYDAMRELSGMLFRLMTRVEVLCSRAEVVGRATPATPRQMRAVLIPTIER